MQVKNLHAVSPRFPAQRFSAQGKSDPKARPKGVVDGQQVNIPVLGVKRLTVRNDGER